MKLIDPLKANVSNENKGQRIITPYNILYYLPNCHKQRGVNPRSSTQVVLCHQSQRLIIRLFDDVRCQSTTSVKFSNVFGQSDLVLYQVWYHSKGNWMYFFSKIAIFFCFNPRIIKLTENFLFWPASPLTLYIIFLTKSPNKQIITFPFGC